MLHNPFWLPQLAKYSLPNHFDFLLHTKREKFSVAGIMLRFYYLGSIREDSSFRFSVGEESSDEQGAAVLAMPWPQHHPVQ